MAKKKKKSRIWTILIILIVILGAFFVYFTLNKSDDTVKVTTSKAVKQTIIQTVSAIGQIEPETEVKISSETSGEIIYLGVEEGDTTKKNQLIVKIKPDIFETQLEQFEASVEAAKMDVKFSKAELDRTKIELERIENLYKKEFSSLQEFQNAKIAYDKASANYQSSLKRLEQIEASLREVRRNAERTTIYSPIEGIVTKLDVELGEKVVGTAQMQGTEMMRIADLNIMNAVVEVDENDIVLVDYGDTATVEIDAFPDKMFKGVIIEIGHSANVSNLGSQEQVTNFNVKIRLIDKEDKLRPGMTCNAEIMTERRDGVVAVPLPAVTVRTDINIDKNPDVNENARSLRQKDDDEGIQKVTRPPSVVFLYNNGKAKLQKVETGISDNGFIEISEGLQEGDEVISGSFMAVSRTLKDGMEVQIDSVANKFRKR